MPDVLRSIHRAARLWLRVPVVALVIVTLTALGIAGVAGLFGPLYSLVLSPLQLPDAHQLVRLGGRIPLYNVYTNAFHERERFESVFTGLAIYAPASGRAGEWRVPAADRPILVDAVAVTSDFFETVGVAPRLGRSLADQPVGADAVVLSDAMWRTQFEQRADVVGTTVDVAGRPRTIVGVMPPGFDFPSGTEAWLPIGSTTYATSGMEAIARLRPGVSAPQASAALEAMGLQPAFGPAGQFGGSGPIVQSLQVYLRGDTRATLWTLWAVSAAFLLLACVGVANLLLAHGVRRRPELLMQAALGASRRRLLRQLLTETLMLVVIGALTGLWLSRVADQWLLTQLPDLPPGQPFMPAIVVLVVGLIVIVTLACGLAPALHATRGTSSSALASPAITATRSRAFFSPRETLAALQLALALALLVGTGLLVRSVSAQMAVPLGFRPDDIVTFKTTLPALPARAAAEAAFRAQRGLSANRATWDRAALQALRPALEPQIRAEYVRNQLFVRGLTERVGALRDVTSVGVVSPTPFTADADFLAHAFFYRVSSQTGPAGADGGEQIDALGGAVSPNAFDLLGIPLLAGRSFTQEDVANAFAGRVAQIATPDAPKVAPVAIINQGLARRLWPRDKAVGKYFNGGDRARRFVVVGVVADFQWTRRIPADRPAVYVPFAGETASASFVVKLREGASVETFSSEVDQQVSALHSGVPRVLVHRLESLVKGGQRDLRLALNLLGGFAALSTLVASLGVYAAVTLSAASRTRELGIRLALGASPTTIRRLLISRVARLLVAVPVGWALGWALAKPLSHLLFQVSAVDLVAYGTSSAVLVIALVAASLVPVLRAGATNPASVLRND